MADYTPATPQVRAAYVRAMRNAFIGSAAEHEAEFDRWLAMHDARIIELETERDARAEDARRYNDDVVKAVQERNLAEAERDNAIRLAGQNHTAYLDAIGAPIR